MKADSYWDIYCSVTFRMQTQTYNNIPQYKYNTAYFHIYVGENITISDLSGGIQLTENVGSYSGTLYSGITGVNIVSISKLTD